MTLESDFCQNPIFYRAEPGGTGAEPERTHRFPKEKRIVRVAEPGGTGAGTGGFLDKVYAKRSFSIAG